MKEFLKELAKHFQNFALAIAVSLVLQPIVQGRFNKKFALWAGIGYISLLFLSAILMFLSELLEKKEE